MSLPVGSTAITGWASVGDTLAWIGTGNPWGLSANDGARFLDLTDFAAGAPFGGVVQTVATSPGASYVLSFDLGSSPSGDVRTRSPRARPAPRRPSRAR